MYEIKIYQKSELEKIRTTTNEDGIPLFCLKDICDILEIANPSDVKNRLVDPYLEPVKIRVQTGIRKDGSPAMQIISMNFVSEAGLFQAVFASRKPNTQIFTQWIMNELLPAVRKPDARSVEYIWERITKNPGELGRLLIDYQNRIDELKTSADKWNNWIANKYF